MTRCLFRVVLCLLNQCLVTYYVDCLGPLCAYFIQYNYAIVFLNQVSRYPHCVPLRSITAKNCCDAMLSFSQHTGFPTKVTMDHASNFFGELTRHFLKRVDCSPIFCTPRHPEANSVERTVGTIKSMIAKVAQDHPRSWHLYLDVILWGLRESVNETTGVSPYTMVYGRLPHGPLSVLHDIWVGEDKFPIPKNKSTTSFLKTCVIDWRLLVLMLKLMLKKSSDVIRSVIIAMLVTNLFLLVSLSLFCRKTRLYPRCLVSVLVLRLW